MPPVKMAHATSDNVDNFRHQANPKVAFVQEEEELKAREDNLSYTKTSTSTNLWTANRRSWRIRKKKPWNINLVNRLRLGYLLERLAAAHMWREASAVLSVLLSGNPRSYSMLEDRRNFLIAIELQRRFCRRASYHHLIKSTYEVWLHKLSWHNKGHKEKHNLQLELALFYISQGKFAEAHHYTRFLVKDGNQSEPFINLIHGMILYQLWYSELPEELQIKDFDAHTTSDAYDVPLFDSYMETEMGESSNGHDAVDIAKASSSCSSESSVANEKIFIKEKSDMPRKKSGDTFYVLDDISQCFEDNDEEGILRYQNNFINSSIYFAPGLDKSLLPIHLKLLTKDPVQSIQLFRNLVNDTYKDAVKYLRLALHSTPPVLAALVPLIQLLLLGDQVRDAIIELDKSCNEIDSALPYRVKARLLQCFCSSQISLISSCYESALIRDPSCNYSMERLIKMHKTGNYSTTSLLEVLARHLDSVDGICSVWEEFSSCFLKLQIATLHHCEDCSSANIGGATAGDGIRCIRVPIMFTEGEVGYTWRLRCSWWATRHFSTTIYLSEIHAGNDSMSVLLEMLARHLDAVDGKCSILEVFATWFLKLQTARFHHLEDYISANVFHDFMVAQQQAVLSAIAKYL